MTEPINRPEVIAERVRHLELEVRKLTQPKESYFMPKPRDYLLEINRKINEMCRGTVGGGGGTVTGPATSTDNAIVLWDGAGGDVIKDSTVLLTSLVNITDAQTINGIKTFGSIPLLPASDPTTDNQAVRRKWIVDNYVALTGNQAVAGIKTFSSFPVTPSLAPTDNYQVANKKYVDDNVGGGGGGTDLGWYNVKDYSVVGNGSTDDYSALNTLINTTIPATTPAGGIVYFPPGTYMLGTELNIQSRGITLLGCSQGTSNNYYGSASATGITVIKATSGHSATALIKFGVYTDGRGSDGQGMRNIMLDGNGKARYLIDAQNVYNSHFENVGGVGWVGASGALGYALRIRNDGTGKGDNNQTWINCHFERPSGNYACGLDINYTTLTCCQIRFISCVFTSSNVSYSTYGTHNTRLGLCDHITFVGCLFWYYRPPAGATIASNYVAFLIAPGGASTGWKTFPHSITFIGGAHYGGIAELAGWTGTNFPALYFEPYYSADSQPVPPLDYRNSSSYLLSLRLVGGKTEKGLGLGFPSPWTTLSYNTGWGASVTALQYMKDPNGMVHIRGTAIRSSGSSAIIATLPARFRPANARYFVTKNGYSGNTAEIVINSAGEIALNAGTATTYVGLDNISFSADG